MDCAAALGILHGHAAGAFHSLRWAGNAKAAYTAKAAYGEMAACEGMEAYALTLGQLHQIQD